MREYRKKYGSKTRRWQVAAVPDRTSYQMGSEREKATQPVAIKIRVRDKDFEPMDNVSVSIEVRDPNDQTVRLRAEPTPGESGLFEAVHVPRFSGGYFARAIVPDEDGN